MPRAARIIVRPVFWHALLFAAAMTVAAQAAPVTLHVAPTGSDDWSGTRVSANQDGTDGPLSTLEKAVEAARAARASGQADSVRILVQPGTYRLAASIELGPEDSGLCIEGAEGEPVVISGGRRVTGWKPWKGEILQADLSGVDLPDLECRELYFGGKLMPWARVPNFDPEHPRTGGFLQNDGVAEAGTKTVFRYKEGELHPEKWAHPERAWMMFHDSLNYETQYCPVKSIDAEKRTVEATRGVYVLSNGNPFYLCGMLEELDAPGEWCVDPESKTLYFWPPEGDPNAEAEVILPSVRSAFVVKGDAAGDKWAEDIRLVRLDIRDFRGRAIQMTGARRCTVAACDLRNCEVGVYLGDDTHACRIAGCDITQMQGDGVSILGTSKDHDRVSDHEVDNNYIWDFGWGRIHNRCGGVYMHRCARIKVTHNHIHDSPRYAIGMDVGNDCEIAYNYGHHVNLVTCDTSIIEAATALDWGMTVEEQRERHNPHNWNNDVHHNLVHDSGGWGTDQATGELVFPHYSWGIYLDLDCSGWRIHDNVCYNTVLGGFMQNGGVEVTVENNIFVDGQRSQIQWNPWGDRPMIDHRCERNIFAYHGKGAAAYRLNGFKDEYVGFKQNLVWSADEEPTIGGVAGMPRKGSWQAWLERGQDEGGLVADPQFVDWDKKDFRLKPTSPAFGLGFKAIDLSAAGNYESPERRTWPRPEVPVVRDEADYTPRAIVASQPQRRDYEKVAVGGAEYGANVGQKPPLSVIGVTEETAAGGVRSLKITEKPGLQHSWEPYITYNLELDEGRLTTGFDLRWDEGGPFVYEWRNDPYVFSLGPQITVDAEGWLAANGKKLRQVPRATWIRFDFTCDLGEQSTGTYDLRVQVAGEEPEEFKALAHQPGFSTLACVVIMSTGEGPATYYLDNVEFRPMDLTEAQ